MYPVLPSANTTTRHSHVYLEANTANSQQRDISKRNSSMIFRIEHLLPTNESAATDIRQDIGATTSTTHAQTRDARNNQVPSGKRMKIQSPPVRSGVYMAQFTPKDTRSETFSTLSVMSTANTKSSAAELVTSYCQLSNGMLCMTPAILRKIKLSEDIHSYNALFEIWNGNVRVRVIRDIAREDELVAWFSEEATLLMAIPFLTPLNIQGNNRYTCHLCQLTFETPNPLKIHLALGCGHHSMDILWIRLHYALKATTFNQQLIPLLPPAPPTPLSLPSTYHQTRLSPTTQQPVTPSSSTNSPSNSPPPPIQPGAITSSHELQRFSAFKPIATTGQCQEPVVSISSPITTFSLSSTQLTTTPSTSSAAAFVHLMHHPSSSLTSSLHPPQMPPPQMGLLQSNINVNPLNAAAQIEAIVSNMGASKQGHLCIYCGKVYSRKYGLKIHIRTHTGFKPLKCKYCMRPFGDPSNLNKHVRLHQQACAPSSGATGNAQQPIEGYKCRLCHKVLARRRDLQRHMETRHSQSMTSSSHGQRGNKTQRR